MSKDMATEIHEVAEGWVSADGKIVSKCLDKLVLSRACSLSMFCDWPVGHSGKHASWGSAYGKQYFMSWKDKEKKK